MGVKPAAGEARWAGAGFCEAPPACHPPACYRSVMTWTSSRRLAPFLVLAFYLTACDRADEGRRLDHTGGARSDAAHDALSGKAAGPAPDDPHAGLPSAPVDPENLPLKETGSGSIAELERGRAATRNPDAAECFAHGFRLTFSSDPEKRNFAVARDLFREAIAADPDYAEAYRGLAYAEFNLGFNREAAFENYKKAIELKPDYGEAHYALAFLYALDDLERGAEHFEKAMKLGVPDERGLRERYYPQVKIETH